MRKILSAIVLSLIIAPAAGADDDEMKAAIDAFAETFTGTWVNESTLDTDVPDVGKKGDKLIAYITFKKQDGLILVDWKGEVNGKPAGSTAKGLMGWDAGRKRLRMRWFATSGSSGTTVYTQRGDRWVTFGQSLDPEGTKGSSRSVTRIQDKDTHIRSVTDRKRGDETLPDREDTWKRKG